MLSGVVLGGTAVACAVLFLLGLVAERRIAAIATTCVCAIGASLILAFLMAGAPPSAIVLPVGLPGSGAVLALDGLSAAFLLLVLTTGAAAAAGSLDEGHSGTGAALPPFIGGMVLTLLAGDAFSMILGFEAMSVASFILVLAHDDDAADRAAALLYLGVALLATACLIPALALLTPSGTPLGEAVQFAAMRAHPPEGLRAIAILVLVLAGAGAKAGLVPLHAWLPPAHAAAPAHVSALMSGAMTKIALYVMIRMLFDLCGPAQPLWWSVPLLVMGATGAVLGGLRATLEGDIKRVLACSTIEHVSLIAMALGIALAARGADLTPLAALALTAALLHIWAHGTFKALLFLCAGAVQRGAGTRSLARLGGLIHHMPVTAACALIGCASLAALPPTSGFAGEWTLLQAILGAPRVGVLAFQILVCAAAALASIAAALAGVAAIRLIGIAFLGRPRSPRAAGASEALPAARWTMLALAAVTTSIGLFPGVAVSLLEPAIRLLLRVSGSPSSLLVIRPQAAAPGYAALGIAGLLAIAGGAINFAYRRRTRSTSEAPAWDCGFAAPPPWMPFGDPATQYTAASFSQPIRRTLGGAILGAQETLDQPAPGDTRAATFTVNLRDPSEALIFDPVAAVRERTSAIVEKLSHLTVRRTLAVMFAALVLFLIAIAAWQQAVTNLLALAAQLVHLALILAAAPLLTGAIQSVKARLLGRTGPSPMQPYRDLARLLRKQPVVAEGASILFHIAPAASLACMIVAAALVPSFTLGMTTAPLADLIVIAGLLAASRAALALAAMDVGTAFGGIGASRDMSFSVFAEPALILVIFTLALLAGSTNLDTVGAALRDNALGLRVSLALAAISTIAVALAETGRLPTGNPTSHLELAMVHEAMVLEHSAAQLAMLDYAAMLKLVLWFTLIGAMFLPAGMADAAAPLGWPIGIFVWLAKLVLASAALAVLETSLAKMRVFRVPEFLGVAVLLALLAVVFLFVSQGFA